MPATRQDVAIRAGVSVATVSHVVNNSKHVSSELKHKVEDAIKFLNYRPNIIARSLKTKTTKHVGILVEDPSNPYFGEIAKGMEEVARQYGYLVSLCIIGGDLNHYFSDIIQRQMDGLFFATENRGFSAENIRKFHENGIQLVNDGIYGSVISFNYADAVNKLMKYFYELGHKRIGFIYGNPDIIRNDPRLQEYMHSVKEFGLEDDRSLVCDGGYPYGNNYQNGYRSMKKLLSLSEKPTAVFAINDIMAIGAIKAINEAGLSIPDDISLAGCDDIYLSECINPALTTIRAQKNEMGRQGMLLLLRQIEENKLENVCIDMELVIRQSTGKRK